MGYLVQTPLRHTSIALTCGFLFDDQSCRSQELESNSLSDTNLSRIRPPTTLAASVCGLN